MKPEGTDRKPWAVLAYTVADDRGGGGTLDQPAAAELKSICSAADFGEMSIAAQVDFKHARGVFRGVLTEAPATMRAFEDIPPESHPLWRGIQARLDRSRLRVQREVVDLNAARANVLTSFLRFGQREMRGRSLCGVLLRPRIRAAGTVLRRGGRRLVRQVVDGVEQPGRFAGDGERTGCRHRLQSLPRQYASSPPTNCATRPSSCSLRNRSCRLPVSGRGRRLSRRSCRAPRPAMSARQLAGSWRSSSRPLPIASRSRTSRIPHRSWSGRGDRRSAEGARGHDRVGAG